jgi:ferric-dicitrate binding protein FerR (iron transport regulator)
MNLQQFNDHLDRHGAHLDAWPETERNAARQLLQRDPEAAAALRTAEAVDAHLARLRAHRAPAGLAARIAATTRHGVEGGWLEALFRPLWRPALLALLPLVAGFVVGLQLPVDAEGPFPETLLVLAFDDELYGGDLYLEYDNEQP